MATKIRQSNLDNSIVTGLGELTSVASGDQTIVYDASSGTLKKISQLNLLNSPTVSSVSPTSVTSGDGTGNYTFTITGSSFTGASASLVNTSGTTVNFDTVTIDSDTQITGVVAKSSLPGSGEPYDVKVTGANNIATVLANQINIDQSPTFNTSAGSLGTVSNGARGSTNLFVEAFDPESAGNVTFELQSGSLPAGVTLATVHENGVSKAKFAGFSAVGSNTTSNFVLRAVDAASNTTSRAFAITVNAPAYSSFTSSGTFAVPAGTTGVTVLVVAGGGGGGDGGGQGGGGGGGGGLIYFPCYPTTAGGTIAVTVGCGGGFTANGQDSVFGASPSPGLGQGGVLTAKGGGGQNSSPGGSGAGGGNPSGTAGSATQPTQPGNSGAYGFGFPGGAGGSGGSGGGGGGAGEAADAGHPTNHGSGGGDGKAYTIADGTTPVGYAGGGSGGGGNAPLGGNTVTPFGGGVGRHPQGPTIAGAANKGGGGGGAGPGGAGSGGGKGIVIVSY